MLGVLVVKVAQEMGFADPTWMDVDSTVQEANIAYPSDANLMRKLSEKAHKVLKYLKDKVRWLSPEQLEIDIQKIRKKSRGYFFLAQNAAKAVRRKVFASYHGLVQRQLNPVFSYLTSLDEKKINYLGIFNFI